MAKRHVVYSEEEIQAKCRKQKNKNTEKSERTADNAFKKFLIACGFADDATNYCEFEPDVLDTYLAKFWFGARKDASSDTDEDDPNFDPELKSKKYTASSLRNYQYALNRILKRSERNYDITNQNIFKKSTEAFADAIKELKSEGKAETKSKPEISEDGKHTICLKICCLH